jgi:hypothetical protein
MQTRTSLQLTVANGPDSFAGQVNLTETPAGSAYVAVSQSIATTWTAVSLGPVAAFDLVLIKNNDPTNYVQLASANDGTGIFGRLTPGRAGCWPVDAGATIYAKAHTAACIIGILGAPA